VRNRELERTEKDRQRMVLGWAIEIALGLVIWGTVAALAVRALERDDYPAPAWVAERGATEANERR
jgi:hypothetical protein